MHSARPPLLFLTTQLPWPPYRGGVAVSWRLLEYLSGHFELSLGCLLKGDDAQHEAALRARLPLADYFSVPCDRPRSAGLLLQSYLRGQPLNVLRNASPAFQAEVDARLSRHPLVLADHYEMMAYLLDASDSRIVYHAHNAEYLMWERYAAQTGNLLRKLPVWLESRRIRSYERQICRRAAQVLAFPNDAAVLQAVSGLDAERFTAVLPCGEEEALAEPAPAWEDTKPMLLYVGTLSWEANIDGLCWMLEQCWPALKAAHPDLEFRIIGSQPDARLQAAAAAQAGVFLEGFVEDLGPYYRQARVFAAPLRFGSGIKLKVLNTLYRGVPVVTTAVGAEGMPLEAGRELYVAGDAAGFIRACSSLVQDRAAWERMRDASRSFAAQHLRNAVQLERIREAILRAAGLASPPAPPLGRGGN